MILEKSTYYINIWETHLKKSKSPAVTKAIPLPPRYQPTVGICSMAEQDALTTREY
jgi:hypothetical protein